jgi:hypothetical protein
MIAIFKKKEYSIYEERSICLRGVIGESERKLQGTTLIINKLPLNLHLPAP